MIIIAIQVVMAICILNFFAVVIFLVVKYTYVIIATSWANSFETKFKANFFLNFSPVPSPVPNPPLKSPLLSLGPPVGNIFCYSQLRPRQFPQEQHFNLWNEEPGPKHSLATSSTGKIAAVGGIRRETEGGSGYWYTIF